MAKRLSYEEVKAYIEGEDGNGCKLISKEYKGVTEKLDIKCNCNEIFSVSFSKFRDRNQRKCKICAGRKTYTYERVKNYFEIEDNSGCSLASLPSEVLKVKDGIKVKCRCGEIFKVNFYNFANGKKQCSKCGFKRSSEIQRKNQSDFIKDVNKIHGNKYRVIGTYINSRKKIEMECIEHGQFTITPSSLMSGCGCKECGKIRGILKMTTTEEEFKNKVFDLVQDEYKIISKFNGLKNKIEFLHNVCGKRYNANPSDFLSGCRCPHCSGKFRKDTNHFKKEVYALVADEYTVLGEYLRAKTKIMFQHEYCGKTYLTTPTNFLSGFRCPYCASSRNSKGQSKIAEYLQRNNFIYETEVTFENCRSDKKRLQFDFAIRNERGLLECLIEFDGEQHYHPIEYFGGQKSFKRQQLNDEIKNRYCENNKIPLLRIPYFKENEIDKLLEDFLKIIMKEIDF